MNVIKSFTLKSLRRNKKRTIVTIIGVIISAAMITAVATLATSFIDMLQRAQIADSGNWHAQISGLSAENFDTVSESGEVDAVFFSRDVGYGLLEGSQSESKPYLYVREYTKQGFDQMSVRLNSGRLPQKSGEVIISESIKNSAGVYYQIGDTLTLTPGQRISADGTAISENTSLSYSYSEDGLDQTLDESFVPFEPEEQRSYSVVGIMQRPSFEYSWSAGCGVLGLLDEAALLPGDEVTAYLTVPRLDRGVYDTVKTLAAQVGKSPESVVYHTELLRCYGIVYDDNLFVFLYGFTGVLIAIIIIASVSLIYNAFAISVSERSRQLGLLASVGATRKQKRQSVYIEGLFIGLIGIPLGLLAGIGGIAVTLAAIEPLLDSVLNTAEGVSLRLTVSPIAVAVAVVCAAVTLFISLWKPARRASKIMPIDAIRQSGDIRLSRKHVKTLRLTRRLFGFEAEVAVKNLKRSRKKYRATIVSLVISLVLFLTVSSYTEMLGTLSNVAYSGVNYDISISYPPAAFAQREAIDAQIAETDGVTQMARTSELEAYCKLKEKQLSDYAKLFTVPGEDGIYDFSFLLVSLDEQSFADYAQAVGVKAGDYTDTDNPRAVLINYGQANYYTEDQKLQRLAGSILNIAAGSELDVVPGSAEDSGEAVPLTIGAVTEERPMGRITQGLYNPALVVSREVFDAIAESLGAEAPNSIYNVSYINTPDDQRTEKQLNAILNESAGSFYIYNVRSAARSEQNVQTFLGVFVYGFLVLISLICIANIFNTVSTNIALRRREFAMLRSVGMTPAGFSRLVRFESIFYGLKGLLFGLPLSVAIAYLLHSLQRSVLGTQFTLPFKSYGFAVLMVLIIVFVTMVYATGRIRKENIVDALRDENI